MFWKEIFVSRIFLFAVLSNFISLSKSDLQDRLKKAKVESSFPNDARYAVASKPYNLRFDYKPAAIAFPKTTEEIVAAVTAASAEGIPVSAKSGGHSYAAYGLGGKDGFLVVDLSKMKGLSVDSSGIAEIQTGNLLGDVAQGLFKSGKKAIPHGTCPYVGTGGHSAFGGFGLTSRKWGLMLDVVVGHEVVLANGSVVITSESEHPDLFWALRGAGASFGIVSTLKVKTYDAPSTMTFFSFSWQISSAEELSQAMISYQDFCLDAELNDGIGMEVNIGQGDEKGQVEFQLLGTLIGSSSGLDPLISPLLLKLPNNPQKTINETDWLTNLDLLAAPQPLTPTPASLQENIDTFYAKSLVTPQAQPATNESLKALSNYFLKQGMSTSLSWFVQLQLYGGKGSFINSVPKESSSYLHRSSLWTIQLYAGTSPNTTAFPSDGFEFVDQMTDCLVTNNPKDWAGGYLNYVDDNLPDDVWPHFYYGDHYKRLTEVKSKYDPQNLFRYPQAVHT
ncbi:hypothetical protein DFH28DRAFT_891880 [Melampsora americana]|nr:hypothetical protein DFH28DRAFT_891880 [Melampsora americana]